MFGAKKVGTTTTPAFGAKAAGTTSFGAKPATSTFGAKPATSAFGAKPAATSSFGAKPATSSFGAKPATSTFGATGAAGTTTAGATTPAAGSAMTFGRTAAGFGQHTAGVAATGVGFGGATASNNPDLAALVGRIQELGNRLHPLSPYCALRWVFYNRVDPSQLKFYKRPETFDPSLWAQAQALNPDPSHLVPHQASGYPDLKARLDAQDSETGSQASALADAETFLRLTLEDHSLRTALKLDQLKRDSLLLSHRLLTVSSHIEILRARGLPIQPDEDAWRQQLHHLLLQLSKPNEYRGRLNELSSRVRMQQQLSSSGISSSSLADSDASPSDSFAPSDLQHFSSFLQHQQTGLEHLIDILNADMKNLQLLQDSLALLKPD